MNRLSIFTCILGIVLASNAGAQTWTPVNQAPNISAWNPLLLTDGTVMIQDADNTDWWKLTPDAFGNYSTGTWSQLAATTGWGPLYYASQVLPDGRVVAMGGEYNFGLPVWDSQGGIYDPVSNTWTTLQEPTGWGQIGDMASITLPNGKVLMADPFSNQDALFNPATNSFTNYGSGKGDGNDEEGLTLMPNGNLFTVDVITSDGAETFNTVTGIWSKLPNTTYNVVDLPDEEVGPAILQYNGNIIQFGGNGSNITFNTNTGAWVAAPAFPKVTSGQLDCADAPGVLLPNGNVLVDAGPGYGLQGCYFFIWNGTTLTEVTGPPDAAENVDYAGNFLLLPNGQVLFVDQSPNVMVYSPGGLPNPAWAPAIVSVPSVLKAGASYTISGTQFNGLSGGSGYGDDEQNETNYPIIKLTMNATGHVYYCKEYNPSTMAICTGNQLVTTNFTVPSNTELGQGIIQVVTNGIPSVGVPISINPPIAAYAVSLFQGTNAHGNLADITSLDGQYYSATSVRSSEGETVSVEADFQLPETTVGTLSVKASASVSISTVTEQVFLYNWVTSTWVAINQTGFGAPNVQTSITGATTKGASNYVSSSGEVRTLVRALIPGRLTVKPYTMNIDLISLGYS